MGSCFVGFCLIVSVWALERYNGESLECTWEREQKNKVETCDDFTSQYGYLRDIKY